MINIPGTLIVLGRTLIRDMPKPQNKEVKCFLGMVTCLGKFIQNLSKRRTQIPMETRTRAGLHKRLKEICLELPVLKYCDCSKPVEIHCNASQSGVGAVLMQEERPIAYTSRAMTDTEKRYSQIEKEMLSIVHACQKFHCYIFGKETEVYNDHKPLEQTFRKPLLSAQMRLQRMLLSLQWYDLTVHYKPSRYMLVPDTLSRAYLPDSPQPEISNV